MNSRPDRMDLSRQRSAVDEARGRVLEALADVATQATQAARPARSKARTPPPIDVTAVYGAVSRLRLAEQDLDLALLDLRTASGDDA